jgi:hypothetical protein
MQHYEDRSSMQAPGLCFVCETAPQAGVVDTLQNFTPGFPSNLDGRKYICDGCAAAAAQACGFYSTTEVQDAEASAEAATGSLNAVIDHVTNAVEAFTRETLEAVGASSAPTVQPEVAPEPVVEAPVVEAPVAEAPVDPAA